MILRVLVVSLFVALAGCGIKGPPLPPQPEAAPAPQTVEPPPSNTPAPEAIKTIKKKKKTK